MGTFFGVLSFLTSAKAGFIYGPLGIAFLLLLGKTRAALVFASIGVTIASVAILGDFTLGEIVDRGRPLAGPENSTPAYPSGHVFGSTVFFGFMGFLAVYYQIRKKLLVPFLAFVVAIILLVGPARIYEQAHWPSDVAAGYLLGSLWLLVLIPVFVHVRSTRWMSSSQHREDLSVVACESCRTARSIASVVLLDREQGTATKVYKPPPVVRLLYWLAFQAKFPYQSNAVALQAADYRRKIASMLTIHRFEKDLVAPAMAVDCIHGQCSFVTEYIPGELAENNDESARLFLTQVAETFAEAGLSVWQINPHNPHAHTNLIRTPEGDFKIIDLESAVVTLLPAPGQFRSALKSGNFPIFDDISFPRLRNYMNANQTALEASLGSHGMAEFRRAADRAEVAINDWKDAEPRLWGHIVSRIYKLLDWKGFFQHLMGAMGGADRAAQVFLNGGIDRWEKEERIGPPQVTELRAILASREAQDALHHLGAHLVLSVAVAIPIPGMRSLARFGWTLAFWSIAQGRRYLRRSVPSAGRVPNIHSPLVMVLALMPGFGAIAYLAARPLRKKLLVRLVSDQVAWKLPFKLYARMRLDRWLAPAPKKVELEQANTVPDETPVSR